LFASPVIREVALADQPGHRTEEDWFDGTSVIKSLTWTYDDGSSRSDRRRGQAAAGRHPILGYGDYGDARTGVTSPTGA
jgi:hypothetical protein